MEGNRNIFFFNAEGRDFFLDEGEEGGVINRPSTAALVDASPIFFFWRSSFTEFLFDFQRILFVFFCGVSFECIFIAGMGC